MSDSRPFVLIHGAFHGGWCYSRVAALLREAGHDVYTPTLTGLGERAHLLRHEPGLSVHVEDILNVIRWEELTDVVLVGHSYGSFVAQGVATRLPERIAAIVLLDGALGADGATVLDTMAPGPEGRAAVESTLVEVDGVRVLPAPPSAAYGVNEADQPGVDARLTPTPFATLIDPLVLANPEPDVPHVYVRSSWPGPGLDELTDRLRATPGWRVEELEGGHDLMIDLPGSTADILLSVAR